MKSTAKCFPVVVIALLAISTSNAALAQTFLSDFPSSLEGWQPQWHKESTTGTPGTVIHTTERGYDDFGSLRFDMGDGLGDDGTLWIEKAFAVPAGVPTPVSVSFQLFNLQQSDFNQFQVKAAIGANNPELQEHFTTIGSTDSAAGWVPFEYAETVTSPTGQAWVALGVRVAWETHREYWIDHVAVTVIPEPTSAAVALLGLIAGAAIWWVQSTRRRGMLAA